MPQPLSSVAQKVPYTLAPRSANYGVRNAIFRNAPMLASMAMEAIAEWSGVEMDIIMLFSRLSHGPQQVAFQIYASLTGKGPKAAALLALVQSTFRPQDMDIFYALKSFMYSCERRRDGIAHNVWGFINGRDDVVLFVNPLDLINRVGDLDRSKVMMWTDKDFIDLAQEIRDLSKCVDLASGLGSRSEQERDEISEMLRKERGIAARIKTPPD